MAVLVPMPSNSTPITWLVANSFLFDRRIIRCIFHLVFQTTRSNSIISSPYFGRASTTRTTTPTSLSTLCLIATWVGINTSNPPCIRVLSTVHLTVVSLRNFLCPDGPNIVIQKNLIMPFSHLQ
ncbi:hypothetical protein LguiB_003193 [Lonicera macranthoides]